MIVVVNFFEVVAFAVFAMIGCVLVVNSINNNYNKK
jgi:hypothetical protein